MADTGQPLTARFKPDRVRMVVLATPAALAMVAPDAFRPTRACAGPAITLAGVFIRVAVLAVAGMKATGRTTCSRAFAGRKRHPIVVAALAGGLGRSARAK